MARSKIVVTNRIHDDVLARLSLGHHVSINTSIEPWSRQELITHASDAEAIMAFMTDSVDAQLLDACPRLRIVAGALKGYDNLDRVACTKRGVWLTIVPDLLTVPTAELTIGLMIAVGRNILTGDRHIRSGAFRGWRAQLYGTGLHGSTIGIIGMGAVGRAIAERLRAFSPRVIYNSDRRPLATNEEAQMGLRHVAIDELLATSDFVVLAVHLIPETKHLICRASIARMKDGAYLINPGRGSLVDETAVADALRNGKLLGYAADVFEMEDWARPDRPQSVAAELIEQAAATVLTPHLGSAVKSTRYGIEMAAATNILECLAGRQPPDAVNQPAVVHWGGSNA
jgi:phosphonate dehydrogenase